MQFKTLYSVAGTEEIIQNFINKRYTSNQTGEDGKLISRKRNKRITTKKVQYIIHLLWVEKLHNRNSTARINKEILQEFFGEKGYHTSDMLKWMCDDGLIFKATKHQHFGNKRGVSSTYCFGDTFTVKNFSTIQVSIDCAFMKRLVEREEKVKGFMHQNLQSEMVAPQSQERKIVNATAEIAYSEGETTETISRLHTKQYAFDLFDCLIANTSIAKIQKTIISHRSFNELDKQAILRWLPIYAEKQKAA